MIGLYSLGHALTSEPSENLSKNPSLNNTELEKKRYIIFFNIPQEAGEGTFL